MSAWEAFDVTDLLLAFIGAAALVLGAFAIAHWSSGYSVASSSISCTLGLVALLLVIWRLVDPPGELSPRAGAWVALVLAAGVFLGGYFGMGEERRTSPPGA